ncbi:MAG: hypothetical protein KDC12_07850 [Flavobacteriales bacterium]|nr:hypothetical protein [Flavobacteriales bacterium]
MRVRWWVALVVFLTACAVQHTREDFTAETDRLHRSLMEGERNLVGDFFTREEFHHEMMFECRDKSQLPYPELDSLMKDMKANHTEVLSNRGSFYAHADSCKKAFDGQSRAQGQMLWQSIETASSLAENRLSALAVDFYRSFDRYSALLEEYGIRRITHEEYGEDLLNRIIQWQDSLMLQGSMIAANLSQLRETGLPKSEGQYKDLYRPISEMQAIHKKFQSKITSAENQQSRYASSRQDEFFYLGPHLVERSDVQMLEGEMTQLLELMQEFRIYDSRFHQLAD